MMTKRFGVGRVRRKLAEMIAAQITIPGFSVWMDPEDLIPNTGYWRTDYRADVMPWTGSLNVSSDGGLSWKKWNIESWFTMTELIRGFTWDRDGALFELYAMHENPNRHPSARNR